MLNKKFIILPVFALSAAFITACGGQKGDVEVDGILTYESNNNGLTVTGVSNDISTVTSITIPNIYNGKTVNKINASAFSGDSKLKKLSIPFVGGSKTATEKEGLLGYIFGDKAYENGYETEQLYAYDSGTGYFDSVNYYIPSSLREVTVTGTQTEIPFGAFSDCYFLTKIDFSQTKAIETGSLSFYHCEDLETVVLPEDLEEIGSFSFGYCYSLTDLTFPASLSVVDSYGFYYCSSLHDVIFLNEGDTEIGNYAFYRCNDSKNFVDPNYVNDLPVFYFCGTCKNYGTLAFTPNTKSLSLNNEIEKYRSSYAVIENYNQIKGVENNLEYAIRKDGDKKVVSITRYVGNDGEEAKKNITIPDQIEDADVTKVCNYAFLKANDVYSVDFSTASKLEYIGEYVLADSNIDTINFPIAYVYQPRAFMYSNLDILNVPAYANSSNLYYDLFKRGYEISSSVSYYLPFTKIKFADNSLYDPTSSSLIPDHNSCTNLVTSIEFGSNSAISGTNLQHLTRYATLLESLKFADNGSTKITTLNSNMFSKLIFKELKLGAGTGLTTISDSTFGGSDDYDYSLSSIDLENATSLTLIGDYAFGNCSELKSITIPDSLFSSENEETKPIGLNTFVGWTEEQTITINNSMDEVKAKLTQEHYSSALTEDVDFEDKGTYYQVKAQTVSGTENVQPFFAGAKIVFTK